MTPRDRAKVAARREADAAKKATERAGLHVGSLDSL